MTMTLDFNACLQEQDSQNQHQHQQKPLQDMLQDLKICIQQMLQEQENRLKEGFSTQITALAARTNTLVLQVSVTLSALPVP